MKVCEKYKMNKLPAEPLKVSIQNVLMPSESKIDKKYKYSTLKNLKKILGLTICVKFHAPLPH